MFHYQEYWIRVREAAIALIGDRAGVTALEYGLMAALVAVAIVASVKAVGTNVSSTFTLLGSKV